MTFESVVVMDLELGLEGVELEVPEVQQPATPTRSRLATCWSKCAWRTPLKVIFLSSWCFLGVMFHSLNLTILMGACVAAFLFSLYFLLMPVILRHLKEEMEANMAKQKKKTAKDRPTEMHRYEQTCPSKILESDEGSEVQEDCAVCLCEMSPGELVRPLACGHVFHKACLDEWWFAQKGHKMTCPLCRSSACASEETAPQMESDDVAEELEPLSI
mmetsp:Transcript_1593/g.3472  ORF Transcript_1593/g.3472 Transcript_1593/m.3472 type:complete len:216 (-) Transcript_1593:141-788(-)|eukprot:CAMPEP_0206524670 /NCGR_PEP_ID=MMETSP0324_2-20121206/68308_1 /ASSEMBLY_ACC=CAM_ASM_000836 /TAXON_ID=2866 /ORGANISM="Crypthecodinium cohnii, Strain Seligo" /LENGTH=215 /DNA_ID=CAMNT_0054019253 /DNA_START=82 /DNA_END=729 /DNA_ORIENTATION=-